MFSIISYDCSEIAIAKVSNIKEKGKELYGYKDAYTLYEIDVIYFDTKNEFLDITINELGKIIGRELPNPLDSKNVTRISDSRVIEISENEKDILLNCINDKIKYNDANRNEQIKKALDKYKSIPPSKRDAYLTKTLSLLESIPYNGELYDYYLKIIKEHNEHLKNLAIKNKEKQLNIIRIVNCSDSTEECNYDIIKLYIDENGKEIEERYHTY